MLRPSGLNPVKILVGRCRDFILQLLKTNLVCKFPCLLNLPPANLDNVCLFLGHLLALCVGGPLSNFTQGTREIANQHPAASSFFLYGPRSLHFSFIHSLFPHSLIMKHSLKAACRAYSKTSGTAHVPHGAYLVMDKGEGT